MYFENDFDYFDAPFALLRKLINFIKSYFLNSLDKDPNPPSIQETQIVEPNDSSSNQNENCTSQPNIKRIEEFSIFLINYLFILNELELDNKLEKKPTTAPITVQVSCINETNENINMSSLSNSPQSSNSNYQPDFASNPTISLNFNYLNNFVDEIREPSQQKRASITASKTLFNHHSNNHCYCCVKSLPGNKALEQPIDLNPPRDGFYDLISRRHSLNSFKYNNSLDAVAKLKESSASRAICVLKKKYLKPVVKISYAKSTKSNLSNYDENEEADRGNKSRSKFKQYAKVTLKSFLKNNPSISSRKKCKETHSNQCTSIYDVQENLLTNSTFVENLMNDICSESFKKVSNLVKDNSFQKYSENLSNNLFKEAHSELKKIEKFNKKLDHLNFYCDCSSHEQFPLKSLNCELAVCCMMLVLIECNFQSHASFKCLNFNLAFNQMLNPTKDF
jgi:hypothetical protein